VRCLRQLLPQGHFPLTQKKKKKIPALDGLFVQRGVIGSELPSFDVRPRTKILKQLENKREMSDSGPVFSDLERAQPRVQKSPTF
jgi:hypothetical protein